ncbi:MAG: hypothetical protein R3194_09620 [Limnobacter sp.]|nr:hypothetical protein [Limnobacter sp.]
MDDEKNWLAADYVLGVLRGEEKLAFEKRMKDDSEMAGLVLDWQKRMELVQPKYSEFCPTMSEDQLDEALGKVFQKVCSAIDGAAGRSKSSTNPLTSFSQEQLSQLRPVVSRLIASYLVILERLKLQQASLAGQ